MNAPSQLLTTRQIAHKLNEMITNYDEIYWAVAWGSDGPHAIELIKNKRKIEKLVIGTDFYQTDPALLEKLAPIRNCRIAGIIEGTFHPKIYLFIKGNKAAAIIGSANFTRGGTDKNIEAAIFLEGSVNEDLFQSILKMVNQLWDRGSAIEEDFLTHYTLQYNANMKSRSALSKKIQVRTPKRGAKHPNLLGLSWSEYVDAIKNSMHLDLDGRLKMISKANQILLSKNSFSLLTTPERKAIAGVVSRNEEFNTELDSYDWGWFGSMIGAGTFRNRIKDNDTHISDGLERIPTFGEPTEEDFKNFVSQFKLAFNMVERKGTIITASRLLALKRPDYFMCVDSKNISLLSNDLGFTKSKLNFETYWPYIVEPITQAKWWQTRRPKGYEGKIWDARAAMLDAIYYDPN